MAVVVASGYELRHIQSDDLQKGLAGVLAQLTFVGDLSEARYRKVFEMRQRLPEVYKTLVVEHLDSGKVVGTATLIVEAKFVHGGSFVGHVEDVVVDEGHRGRGLAQALLARLTEEARKAECYKVILDCNEKNVPFYEKCGYRKVECQMRLDLPRHERRPRAFVGLLGVGALEAPVTLPGLKTTQGIRVGQPTDGAIAGQ